MEMYIQTVVRICEVFLKFCLELKPLVACWTKNQVNVTFSQIAKWQSYWRHREILMRLGFRELTAFFFFFRKTSTDVQAQEGRASLYEDLEC